MTPLEPDAVEGRLRSAVDAGDWAAVYALLDEAWIELFQSAPAALLAALEAMPDAVIAREPKLRLAREYISRNLNGEDHSTAYRHSVADIVPLDVVDRMAILTGQIAAARSDGRGAESVRLVATAHALLAVQGIERGPELAGALPEFHYQWGLTLERAGELEAALADYMESFDWAISIGHRMMQATSAGAIAYLHALHGRIAMARTWLEKQPPVEPGEWWESSIAVQARLAGALAGASEFGPSSRPDPLEGVSPNDARQHWGAYFYVRAVSVPDLRGAHLLGFELDSFLVGLPKGQRLDSVAAEYLDLARLIITARAQKPHALENSDRPNETASVLRQLAAATRGVRLARAGMNRQALKLTAPLLRVDGSRPRVLVLALIATAIATHDADLQRSTLAAAAAIARTHRYYSAFAVLPPALRREAATLLDAVGAGDAAVRLRTQTDEPATVRFLTLTKRERAVIEQTVAGASVAEIAGTSFVSVNTVKTQLRSAFRKLEVSSRSELMAAYFPLPPS
ncbi:DNA-binding response regulator, NarL/FixJ family, contains REC and HTH domains [Rathayibacter oskolensis]|uniref:DNA-binding response regulator, NarL/FixJ family, contains REC and HTH domains n=1 Tax=Rathayibacter oskolensis TaxID=1891671 RepID=A0A1X7PFH3_9MICO|nr:helix-turn-helix transcriptional regulator [Rathayibacter oskolensis]SMH49521.1 DNA-binding response regulator, NarL/FixJ family, contains REC and HTH domains [Rathayibacter oskolensis]